MRKKILNNACFFTIVIGLLLSNHSCGSYKKLDRTFSEEDGLLVIEPEQVDLVQDWPRGTEAANYSGKGYIYWTGGQFFDTTGHRELVYPIDIQSPGVYRITWRVMVGKGEAVTEHNDHRLKIQGAQIYGEQANGHQVLPRPLCEQRAQMDCPNGSSTRVFFNKQVQDLGHKNQLLVGTSYSGIHIPQANVVEIADYLLLDGNGVEDPDQIAQMVKATRAVPGYKNQPILFNEDDHYDFDQPKNNLMSAVETYASWGYFDFRRAGDEFAAGFQSVPVD